MHRDEFISAIQAGLGSECTEEEALALFEWARNHDLLNQNTSGNWFWSDASMPGTFHRAYSVDRYSFDGDDTPDLTAIYSAAERDGAFQ